MEIRRRYQPKQINWYLVPDLMRKAEKAIPNEHRVDSLMRYPLVPSFYFEIRTYSQLVEMESDSDFLSFLQSSTEPPLKVEARIDAYMKHRDGALQERNPPFWIFSWSDDELAIEIRRSASSVVLPLLDEFEKTLELQPVRLPEPQLVADGVCDLPRTVFIAHSFDETGRSYAYQLTKFVSLLGFEVATGEGFSPENVSSKVRRRLSAQRIVIAIISEREDFTWLIQEMTGASFIEKPLFILVEEGAPFKPGVLGDLEYIRFGRGRLSDCFTSILEGLREIGFEFS